MRINLWMISVVLMVLSVSCSSTKNLPANENLYTGAKIQTTNTDAVSRSERKAITEQLEALTRPRPNSSFLGIKWKLWFYNMGGFFRKKFGEPPVLSSDLNLEKNRAILANRLENKGFLHAVVTADTVVKKREMKAVYTASFGTRYKLRKISYPTDSSDLSKHIAAHANKTILHSGDPYDLDKIIAERNRIDALLKDEGFFYFSADYLIANVDTTVGNNEVDVSIAIKPSTPLEARAIYSIQDAIVYADYELNRDDTSAVKSKAQLYNGYYIIDPEKRYKPSIFSRTLIFEPGDIYKRSDHNLTLNRLTTLGVFKFVKVRFEPVDTVEGNKLNAFYYLTRLPKRSLRAVTSGLTKSSNATGSELSISYRNRNWFKGAELLTVTIFGGIEKQVSGNLGNITTNRLGADVNVYFPRIIRLFKFRTNSGFVPKTRINIGYEMYNRNTQYTLNQFKFLLGFNWKEDVRKEHQLNILAINLVNPLNITASYQKLLDQNINLRRTIEEQLTIGSIYNYNFNSQIVPNNKRHNFYFNGNADLSGNIIGLLSGANIEKGKVFELRGVPVAQYSRLEAELRHYLRLSQNNVLASRLLLGSGWAYGNSREMPFSKAFFIGGTNSIRAFRARTLGPGVYDAATDANYDGFIPDQPGDIKMEMNVELRSKLYSIIHGALFIDAGNIWTQREDPTRPGAKFTGNFLNQLAVGAGFGLRFDLNFIVLRADLAFPIRKPFLQGGPRWVIDEIDFSNRDWRGDNLILNLAIGYPF